MRYGHTSVVILTSKVTMSVVGFLATLYLAQRLGSTVLGKYFLVVSLIVWLDLLGSLGIHGSVKKRLTEEGTSDGLLTAGVTLQVALIAVLAALVLGGQPYLNAYVEADAAEFLLVMLVTKLFYGFVVHVLDGQQLVHISSTLDPLNSIVRALVQVGLAYVGYGLVGLFVGYIAAGVVTILVGLYFVDVFVAVPRREDYASIYSFARYSWLSVLRGRAFQSLDTLVLGLFVPKNLIGIYEIAWNVARFLSIFGNAVHRTLFPSLSELSSKGERKAVAGLTRVGTQYTGLLLIPGLVGGAVTGDVVLSLYGSEFVAGYTVLLILVVSNLLFAYTSQFTITLDAINRPDVSFRINVAFLAINLTGNVALVYLFGWVGAAVASAVAAGIGHVVGYREIQNTLPFDVPRGELLKQWVAAGVMGAVVYVGRAVLGDAIRVVLPLIALGGVVYFAVLMGISPTFRETVRDNFPLDVA